MLLFVLFEFTKIPIICDLTKKKYLCLTYIRTRTMKRTILLTAAILCAASIRAQDLYNIKEPPATEILSRPVEAGRIHRTEVVPYDKRHDADARNRAGVEAYIAYTPEAFAAIGRCGGRRAGDRHSLRLDRRRGVPPPRKRRHGLYPHGQRQRGGRGRRLLDARRIRADALHPRRQERRRADAAPQRGRRGSTPPRRRARHSRTATSTRRPNARSATSRSRSSPTPPANSAYSNWPSSPRTLSTTTNPSPWATTSTRRRANCSTSTCREVVIPGRTTDTVRFSALHLRHQRQQMGTGRQESAALQSHALHAPRRSLPRIHAAEDRLRQDRSSSTAASRASTRRSNSSKPATTPPQTVRPPSRS